MFTLDHSKFRDLLAAFGRIEPDSECITLNKGDGRGSSGSNLHSDFSGARASSNRIYNLDDSNSAQPISLEDFQKLYDDETYGSLASKAEQADYQQLGLAFLTAMFHKGQETAKNFYLKASKCYTKKILLHKGNIFFLTVSADFSFQVHEEDFSLRTIQTPGTNVSLFQLKTDGLRPLISVSSNELLHSLTHIREKTQAEKNAHAHVDGDPDVSFTARRDFPPTPQDENWETVTTQEAEQGSDFSLCLGLLSSMIFIYPEKQTDFKRWIEKFTTHSITYNKEIIFQLSAKIINNGLLTGELTKMFALLERAFLITQEEKLNDLAREVSETQGEQADQLIEIQAYITETLTSFIQVDYAKNFRKEIGRQLKNITNLDDLIKVKQAVTTFEDIKQRLVDLGDKPYAKMFREKIEKHLTELTNIDDLKAVRDAVKNFEQKALAYEKKCLENLRSRILHCISSYLLLLKKQHSPSSARREQANAIQTLITELPDVNNYKTALECHKAYNSLQQRLLKQIETIREEHGGTLFTGSRLARALSPIIYSTYTTSPSRLEVISTNEICQTLLGELHDAEKIGYKQYKKIEKILTSWEQYPYQSCLKQPMKWLEKQLHNALFKEENDKTVSDKNIGRIEAAIDKTNEKLLELESYYLSLLATQLMKRAKEYIETVNSDWSCNAFFRPKSPVRRKDKADEIISKTQSIIDKKYDDPTQALQDYLDLNKYIYTLIRQVEKDHGSTLFTSSVLATSLRELATSLTRSSFYNGYGSITREPLEIKPAAPAA